MKKIILLMTMMAVSLPALAVCSITGDTCSAYQITKPALQDKYLPDNLKEIQKPTAFTPHYFQPYHDALINTETGAATQIQNTNNYYSNCQFGICLPGQQPMSGVVE